VVESIPTDAKLRYRVLPNLDFNALSFDMNQCDYYYLQARS